MPEYDWMCLNKKDSAYASSPKYAKFLNMAKLWIWQVSQNASFTQRCEYAFTEFLRILLIGKKHRWYIKPIIYKRLLNWNITFKKIK